MKHSPDPIFAYGSPMDRLIIKGDVSEGALCEVYNMNGRKLHETNLTDGEMNTIDLPDGLHGVLMVRVTDGVRITTSKVVVL